MRRWWTEGPIGRERVCYNHSPLAQWAVPVSWSIRYEYCAPEELREIRAAAVALDHRAIFMNKDKCIFADQEAAVLFMMKFGR